LLWTNRMLDTPLQNSLWASRVDILNVMFTIDHTPDHFQHLFIQLQIVLADLLWLLMVRSLTWLKAPCNPVQFSSVCCGPVQLRRWAVSQGPGGGSVLWSKQLTVQCSWPMPQDIQRAHMGRGVHVREAQVDMRYVISCFLQASTLMFDRSEVF